MKPSGILTFLRSLPHLKAFLPPSQRVCKPRSAGRLGSSPVVLPGLNFLGGIIIFEWLLYNGEGSLEGFHRPVPAPCMLVSARRLVPPAAPGPPEVSRHGLRHNMGVMALGMGCQSSRVFLGVPTVPKAGQDAAKRDLSSAPCYLVGSNDPPADLGQNTQNGE